MSGIVTGFGVDAVFFDTAGFWSGDPRHPGRCAPNRSGAIPICCRRPKGGGTPCSRCSRSAGSGSASAGTSARPACSPGTAGPRATWPRAPPGRAAPESTRRAFAPARPLAGHLPVVGIVGDTLADHGEEGVRICRWAAARAASARREVEPR
ncbi:hypothetical protein [Spongiactinospora sp. 9N601]|uniref:hypothetical protein n=1 Tax=Spongiactinospora sp. 9N601 TaxID=3375149 RepID=UPI003787609C